MLPAPDNPVLRYHDGTKHHFNRFAQSLGYLDWASQPRPFRTFHGALSQPLYPSPDAASNGYSPSIAWYGDARRTAPVHFSAAAVGDLLRHSLGLSAWKRAGNARWSLRVNPSSGNLHPTEAYIVCGALDDGVDRDAGVFHYSPESHGLERRCAFSAAEWPRACGAADGMLVVLTSIHWRESWKYGERAFRYCQHDLGHAIAAVAIAAEMLGWKAALLSSWSHVQMASLVGLDRDEDFVDAEPEEPGCVLALTVSDGPSPLMPEPAVLLDAVRAGQWTGKASQLSEDHVQWAFIDEIAAATRAPARPAPPAVPVPPANPAPPARPAPPAPPANPAPPARPAPPAPPALRPLVLQRRSALAFDGSTAMADDVFFHMLHRIMPDRTTPSDALWWTPRIHLALFVHRVTGVASGLYLLTRDPSAEARLRVAMQREFLFEADERMSSLFCLVRGDCRSLARRLNCDQDIAADGAFSLGMLADFESSLLEDGDAFYRHLFWESGVIGQILYLEAEAAGVRATGIGCFYDDPVHDLLGLTGHAFQSLYHFTVGTPVEDRRLTVEPGYPWEAAVEPPRSSIG